MLPIPATSDSAYGTRSNSEQVSQIVCAHSRSVITPYLSHSGLRKLCVRVLLPFGGAPLFQHVLRILSLGAEKQVGRVTASAIVTPMANAQAIRNRPVHNLPGHTVGGLRGTSPPVLVYLPVPFRGQAGLPLPAVNRLGHSHEAPEPLLKSLAREIGHKASPALRRVVLVAHSAFSGLGNTPQHVALHAYKGTHQCKPVNMGAT